MDTILNIVIPGAIVLLAVVAIGIVFARLYKRASKETAFVRTGLGGQKVIMDGGAFVLPVFHETISVNMNTLKLEVSRVREQSLIALDRMRVDVAATFFVRVKQTAESVSTAAQTLGRKTMEPGELKVLVEDKFVDALRATAATMTMKQLQDQRRDFVQAVQNAVAEDLEKNGLELESVSLTSLDQTAKEFFNPNNAFDAEGLTQLTKETESRRRERNEIEQDTMVRVREKNLEAERQRLSIERDQEFATLTQHQEVANARAEQVMTIAKTESERTREAEEVRITNERQVKERKIAAEQAVATAEIDSKLVVKTRQIESDRATAVLEAEQRQVVQVAEQTSAIAIALKSKDQSQADAEANEALAEAVRSEEGVVTARETAVAERSKAIQLIDAQRVAEQQAIGVRIGAEVERDAAENRAQAVRVVAEAQRDAALAEAEGISAVNEARNRMGESQINMTVRMRLIDNLPTIIQNMVKPMEKIDSIKLFHVTGMPGAQVLGHDGAKTVSSGGGQGSMPEQVMNAALQYQVGKPFLDAIMADAGLDDTSISGLSKSLATMAVPGALIPGAAANESAVSALALGHGGAPAGALTADSAS